MQLNKFISDIIEPKFEIFDWTDYRIGYFISRSYSKDTENEDVILLREVNESLLAVIADGAGGHPKGRDAAYSACEALAKSFGKDENIIRSIEKANQAVVDLKVGAHSTLACLSIEKNILRCHSIGDSEIVFWNSLGNEIYSNIPDSNVGYKVEAGLIKQADSLEQPDRYLVNNMLGDSAIRIESVSGMEFKKGQTVIIGSDGVFDNISHLELSEMIGKGTFEKSFEALVDFCVKQDKKKWIKDDDISFVVIRKTR